MIDDLNSLSRACLRELFRRREPIDVYELHCRWRFSPFSLYAFFVEFSEKGVVEIVDQGMRLTEEGRQWVLGHRQSLFLTPPDRGWARDAPPDISSGDVNLHTYLPHRDKNFAAFFEKLTKR